MAKDTLNKKVMGNDGTIVRVQGPIVDVLFKGKVPQIYEALTIDLDKKSLVLETNELA